MGVGATTPVGARAAFARSIVPAYNKRAAGRPAGEGGAMPETESHYVNRAGWLRAAVLGANDGIISTASLVVGVAAAAGSRGEILTAAIAGWAAGAMSMAAGEYVSVSSQADSEAADLEREQRALTRAPAEEKAGARPYLRGAGPEAEARAAGRRSAHGQGRARRPCARRARLDRGRSSRSRSRPPSPRRLSFSVGAALPTLAAFLAPRDGGRHRRVRPPRWFFSSRSARSAPGRAARRSSGRR